MFGNILNKIKVHIYNSFTTSPYTIMSLGPNCYPRTVLTRTGLIKHKKEGQKSYPFDLAWFHRASYVTEFLENNFENFLSELKYSDYSSSWDNGEKINFSHEAYIGPNEKNKLIRVYNRRIKNFAKELSNDKPILFLQILKDEKVGEDCINTYKVIQKLCKNRKFLYVVIDFINILPDNLENGMKKLNISLPTNNTDVFSKEFYTSNEGIVIENQIKNYIENLIQSEWGINPTKFL